MRIISKIKDFYDYVQGIVGIDDKAYFERKDIWFVSKMYRSDCESRRHIIFGNYEYIFDIELINPADITKKHVSTKWGTYLIEYTPGRLVFKEKRFITRDNSEPPIKTWVMMKRYINDFSKDVEYNNEEILTNSIPVFVKTDITESGVNPQEVFIDIQDYLMSRYDMDIKDTRDDKQKVKSHGFDEKYGFRKRK